MSDPRDRVWEDRADRAYSQATYHPVKTGLKWGGGFLALIIALTILFGAIHWVGSWGGTAVRLTGPQHTEEQVTAVLGDYTSLKAAAGNACAAKNATPTAGDPQLVEDPAFAYAAQYRRIEADYDRRMSNLFEAYVTAQLPLPGTIKGLPKQAPTLKQMQAEVC